MERRALYSKSQLSWLLLYLYLRGLLYIELKPRSGVADMRTLYGPLLFLALLSSPKMALAKAGGTNSREVEVTYFQIIVLNPYVWLMVAYVAIITLMMFDLHRRRFR